MSVTDINLLTEQIQKFWAPQFMPALREKMLLASLVNKEYTGDIKKEGDQVTVSQLVDSEGQIRTVGTDADVFESTQMAFQEVAVVVNKRIVHSFELQETASVLTQLESKESVIRDALMFGAMKKLNNYLYSLVSPSTSSPDHLLNSISAMDAAQVSAIRLLAAQAKWAREKGWYGLVDPSYYADVLNSTTLTSADYVDDKPVIGGQISQQRMGFNILEDDSRGADKGLFFHPDFMYLVMQSQPRFKISDLHSNKQFGYVISVDFLLGAKLGVDGSKKHIWATAASSGIGV